MAQELEPLNLRITGNANGLSAALGKAQKDVSGFASNLTSKIAALVPGLSLGAFGGFGLKAASEFEVVQAKFKTLTGSAENASKVVKELRNLAAETPLTFQGASQAATTLLAYDISANDLVPTLQMLGDVALGDQEKLGRLAVAFGQVSAKGKLMAQEVNQMVENGFNPLVEISERTGLSMSDLYKKMEAGQISFDIVVEAFKSATSEGGRFFEALKNQGQTLSGRISQLADKLQILAAKIGEILLPVAKVGVEQLTLLVGWFQSLDSSAVETATKIAAFSVTLAATAAVVPTLISMSKKLVVALKSIASAEASLQALSGPAGWATLLVGALASVGAIYGVDSLFDSIAESQSEAASSSEDFANGLKQINDRASQTSEAFKKLLDDTTNLDDAQAKLDKNRERWQKQAESLRDSLATPAEKYKKTIEELSQAVLEGGLEMEFFARGVEKAREELDAASRIQVGAVQAKLKGSQADLFALSNPQPVQPQNNVQAAVQKEIQRLQQRIDQAEKDKKANEMNVVASKIDLTNEKLDELRKAYEAKPNTKPVNL